LDYEQQAIEDEADRCVSEADEEEALELMRRSVARGPSMHALARALA
jgi:hypothetical protein